MYARLDAIREQLRYRRRLAALRASGVEISAEAVDIDGASRLAPGAHVAHHASIRASSVGPYTSIGRFSKIAYADIGPYCSISWDCTIGAVGHPLDRVTTHAFPYAPQAGGFVEASSQQVERATLGADVWIGANAVIMPGVEIAPGAAIGASAVVTRDVAPYTVVAGVPARPTGTRVDEDLVDRLLRLAWWEWPRDRIERAVPLFRETISDEVLDRLEHHA